jgi:hypothetical protein
LPKTAIRLSRGGSNERRPLGFLLLELGLGIRQGKKQYGNLSDYLINRSFAIGESEKKIDIIQDANSAMRVFILTALQLKK